jgi:hypothetical protein
MESLSEACSFQYEDENDRILVAMKTIAAGGGSLGESTLKFYLEPLAVSSEAIDNCVAYFLGMGLIDVVCDCSDTKFCFVRETEENSWFTKGRIAKELGNNEYVIIKRGVVNFATKVLENFDE